MLTTGKAILDVANEKSFAVPAFNISDYAMFNGIVDISEEKSAPLFIGIHPDEVRHLGVDAIAAITQRAHRSSVPIAIHWDHGATYEEMLTAIQVGFTSVMIDASLQVLRGERRDLQEGRRDRARGRPVGRGRAGDDRQDRQRGRGR